MIIFVSAPTCFDGVQNEGETQIDCGGPCVGVYSCADGDSCSTSSDCISNNCVGDVCMGKCVIIEVEQNVILKENKIFSFFF
jgi:hypothetical protein